ncbi:MAG: hypothetical protein KIT69_20685, partial [Propionibacteriaceae bacterium]|nr:hypothetical protein [Propionibacteriaceae bacterium]
LNTNATTLQVAAATNVWINDTSVTGVNLVSAASSGAFDLVSASGISVSGLVSADTVSLVNNSGNLALGANITGTTSVNLNSAGTIFQTLGTTINGGGALTVAFVTGPVTLATDVASIAANAPAQTLTINETNALSIGNTTLGTFIVNANGSITTTGAIATTNIDLNANGAGNDITVNGGSTITASNSASLDAADDITVAGSVSGTTLAMNGDAISVGGTVTGTSTIAVNAANTIGGAGSYNGGALSLSWVNGTTTINTNVASLTTVGGNGNSLTVTEANAITLLGQTNVNNFNLTAGGTVTTAADIAVAGDLNLTATGLSSNIVLNSNITSNSVGGALSVNAGGTITQQAGTIITSNNFSAIFGTGPVTLRTNVNAIGTLAPGQSLTINESNGISLAT